MSLTFVAPENSTTVRQRDRNRARAIGVMRTYFRLASAVWPGLARRQAERLFTTPPRYAGRRAVAADAARAFVTSGRDRIAVWQAGPAGAPAVLLSHGWGGRGAQMGSFVAPLLARGFRVVWFDQPGHGDSGRGRVGLPDFVRAIHALAQSHGPFAAAIGHSLGAAALGLALRAGMPLARVALVSSPASMSEHTRQFARLLGIPPRVRDAMRRRIERRYGVRFADIDRIEDLARLQQAALFVHDTGDAQIPFAHALRLAGHLPNARLTRTYGFGHHRILREPVVVDAIADFIAGRDDVPAELPVLPRPAPIY
jgi:pimeloyl-ACP methyl ester carboxylesterase